MSLTRFLRKAPAWLTAQVCNLPYRRFLTCRGWEGIWASAAHKSAIQPSTRPRYAAAFCCTCLLVAAGLPRLLLAQNYAKSGGEYAVAGNLPGDQVHPHAAINSAGGYLVWEDNTVDGDGMGLNAIQLDRSLSGTLSSFKVNANSAGDQLRPQVSLLKGGGAAFVWQGGVLGREHIYARFLSSSNTWLTSDIQVNTFAENFQSSPGIVTLNNGNVVITWSSFDQQASNSMHDVYGQLLSPTGEKIGSEFPVNQFTSYNQRTPTIAAAGDGGFVVVWVSEQQRSVGADSPNQFLNVSQLALPSVDIYGRLFGPDGTPVANEFIINTNFTVCANPRVATGPDGGFMVVWGQNNNQVTAYSWDVACRSFSSTGVGGATRAVNTRLEGDQFSPQISSFGNDYLVVWTGLAQDGSMEGVFGQFINNDGSPSGGEFQVNTTWISKQMHQAIASDGAGRFLVTWTSYGGGPNSFDLYAQRYSATGQPLLAMGPPFVYVPFVVNNNVYQPQIQVSWPIQAGLAVDHYQVYVDGPASPAVSTGTNIWLLTGLSASSTHTFQVAYVTADGRQSPLSAASSATTWSGFSWGGIPFEWMQAYYGSDTSLWPRAGTMLGNTGPTLQDVFLSGSNPLLPSTWLRTQLSSTSQGFFLNWNPQPGFLYQVQTSADLDSWANVGTPRFSVGSQDSINVGGSNLGYYRVLRLR